MVVAVSMHFRAGCFSTCRVGMGHRSGLVGEGVAHVQVFIGGFNNRKLTGKITYRKQKADNSLLISDDVSRESFNLLNQRFLLY